MFWMNGRTLPVHLHLLLVHFRSLLVHFRSTFGPLPDHFWTTGQTLDGHGRTFPKFADIRTEKNVTPKDPLRINAWDLKKL